MESLLNIQVDFTRSLALFTRIFDYFDREIAITSPPDGKRYPMDKDCNIQFSHVSFSYLPEKPLLTDVNFYLPTGKTYAIVGPSGSGKSTLVNLIPRLYDVTGGYVFINGVDVRRYDLTYLRSRIASIHDFILRQPDGYDTEVGNRGLKLSGGEKQRLSIARVILKNPRILILDEATSALDSISENAIQDALETIMRGRTSIVIAHRLSTILKADSILVVKDGVIAEQGTHDELLAKGGVYRELYETQFRKVLDYESGHDGEQQDDAEPEDEAAPEASETPEPET